MTVAQPLRPFKIAVDVYTRERADEIRPASGENSEEFSGTRERKRGEETGPCVAWHKADRLHRSYKIANAAIGAVM